MLHENRNEQVILHELNHEVADSHNEGFMRGVDERHRDRRDRREDRADDRNEFRDSR